MTNNFYRFRLEYQRYLPPRDGSGNTSTGMTCITATDPPLEKKTLISPHALNQTAEGDLENGYGIRVDSVEGSVFRHGQLCSGYRSLQGALSLQRVKAANQ
ncbi:hypothetical protein IQ268_13950 [Oculatella sp. LEGE 06141]|uniref:hypothetical protein n=1 Tax=Oculatella sp. LEGE 06141 TaxID=1828648 RepID=UPI00187F688C|nr:hypothetical protein [Oculatella sp. LEGE 06141]MBE9179667.1 hypothetical protein [Oculatella sp. LEGE 06141]